MTFPLLSLEELQPCRWREGRWSLEPVQRMVVSTPADARLEPQ